MRIINFLGIALLIFCADSATASSSQFALPGYIQDPESLQQTTPQLVFTALRDTQESTLRPTSQEGVFLVGIIGDPASTTYVFFGKGHWAYPSVIRLRRGRISGAWVTFTSFLCAADKSACNKLSRKIQSRPAQVVNADQSVLASAEIKRLLQPLPDGINPPGEDLYINGLGLLPGAREYDWTTTYSMAATSDSDCKALFPRYALPPNYPTGELFYQIGGQTDIILTIDGSGRVTDGAIIRSSRNRNLDAAALGSVSVMRFKMKGCDTTSSTVRVQLPILFVPSTDYPSVRLANYDASALGY